jgi:hypothetical protein
MGRDGRPELVVRGKHPVAAVPMLPRRRHEIGQPSTTGSMRLAWREPGRCGQVADSPTGIHGPYAAVILPVALVLRDQLSRARTAGCGTPPFFSARAPPATTGPACTSQAPAGAHERLAAPTAAEEPWAGLSFGVVFAGG